MVKPSHSAGMAGDTRRPWGVGRRPRMPSTMPTMTVDAVPVSQCTWARPGWGVSWPSMNWECT